jgi:YfiH family protein
MDDFSLVDLTNGWTVGRFASLDGLPGVRHFVTTRKALDVGLIASDRPAAAKALAEAIGAREITFLEQIHSDTIIEAPVPCFPESSKGKHVSEGQDMLPANSAASTAPGFAGKGDSLMTDVPGQGLMCVSADCPLVLIADQDGRAVGVCHASWRGTVKQIAFKLARRMTERYQLDPARLVACICPSAGPERYEVGPDVLEAALKGIGPEAAQFFHERSGKTYLDLWAANRSQLLSAGVREENVHVAGVCTITRNDLFPSYRVEGAKAGRFAAVITTS